MNILYLQLILDYGSDTLTTEILDAYDFYILVSMNPDGYEYSRDEVSKHHKCCSLESADYIIVMVKLNQEINIR